ncbi:DUF2721 domain-containing protein [Erythrobacter rubeus]|nr:DUF2721 domain-containing protein [Erythrobacter rubeus]
MLEIFAAADIATELIQRTASTPAVQQALQSSLAPAFLLVGIGSVMNVMMARLTWVAGRIERLEAQDEKDKGPRHAAEVDWLCKRRALARKAIMLSSAGAVIISIVIALLFVSTYISARIGTVIAVMWVLTIAFLISALFVFLRETQLAAGGPNRKDKSA